jgi:membrane glycosyltransferase
MELPVATKAVKGALGVYDSSYVRTHGVPEDPRQRALLRVSEYLRVLGLSDRLRVALLAEEIVSASEGAGNFSAREGAGDAGPALCVEEAQRRVTEFRRSVFGVDEAQVDALWFRSFIGAYPDAFLGDVAAAREAVKRFGDPFAGRPPLRQRFREQSLARIGFPRWALGLLPGFVVSAAGTALLVHALSAGGLLALELVWAGLFSTLCFLACVGLTSAIVGFLHGRVRAQTSEPANTRLPRSALLLPIYHESAEHVFAGIAAMRESLARTPGGEAFEIFVLSDSREPEKAAEEERAYRRVVALDEAGIPVYYRRRSRNERQKAGNLAEFFERFGHRYTYAVILDADSLMRGETLVEMVRRMEASPRVALLQAPLSLHRGETMFARAQQFVASVCGPMFTRGLALWAGPDGNYYGHNAVVRVGAFLECCALPVLSGEPPLGGHILSHDFVEAALLCRRGWEVRIAHDLEGSWEELPATLSDYVVRDRRWCQGNLQHVRIAFSQGLRPMSRVHMLVGAAQYLAAPLWLAFVGVGAALIHAGSSVAPTLAWSLTGFALGAQLLPRLLGLIECLRERALTRQHGGVGRLTLGVLLEAALSLLLAPLLMMHHTRIIVSILIGRTVRWGAQSRRAQGKWSTIARAEWPTVALGAASLALSAWFAPALTLLLAPLWLPCLLAIPLSLLVSVDAPGRLLSRLGLFRVPSESEPDELLLRAEDLRALTMGDASARFRDVVLDPVLNQSHVARLRERGDKPPAEPEALERLVARALRGGPTAVSRAEREQLLADPDSMLALHREAWRSWPVESFQLSRDDAQLPLERLSLPYLGS